MACAPRSYRRYRRHGDVLRVNVPIGQQSLKVIDTAGRRQGFSIQNVSAVDIYYSDDQRTLDSVPASNLPQVGHLLAASSPNPPPTVYPWFIGRLYVRAQTAGAQLEIIVYEVDPPC
jgi:hypothetical protein